MADDPADEDILEVLNRVGPKWTSLTEMIKTQIAEILKERGETPPEQGGSYLEKQNAMLLAELLKLKKGSTPEPSGQQSSEPSNQPELSPTGPGKKGTLKPSPTDPAKPKAFWR